MKAFQGHVPFLLRHPCGASVIDALYDRADPKQRNAMAAEMYGKEYTILTQASGLDCSHCVNGMKAQNYIYART